MVASVVPHYYLFTAMPLTMAEGRFLRARNVVRLVRSYFGLPASARRAWRVDSFKLVRQAASPARCIDAGLRWLCAAQDFSASADGGVARHYSLVAGWGESYPETTGYIVPTLLMCARELN